jgi:hypothetical protein
MKILLLICSKYQTIELSYDKHDNYFELLLYHIKSYFIDNPNNEIQIITMNCNYNIKMIETRIYPYNSFPYVDHIILLDKDGFYKRDEFYNYIKKYVKYSISSICHSNKYKSNEHHKFYFKKIGSNNKNEIKIPIPYISYPFNLLMSTSSEYNYFNTENVPKLNIYVITHTVQKMSNYLINKLNKLCENNIDIIINITVKDTHHLYNYKLDEFTEIDNIEYSNMIHFYQKQDVCIIENNIDYVELINIAMNNVVVVTDETIINQDLINKYNFITFKNTNNKKKFNWSAIFNKMRNKNIISNETEYTIGHTFDTILTHLKKFEGSVILPKELPIVNQLSVTNNNKDQFINDALNLINESNNINNIYKDRNETNKIYKELKIKKIDQASKEKQILLGKKKRPKRPMLLQSAILNK